MNALRTFLEKYQASAIEYKTRQFVALDSEVPYLESFKILVENHILSAPVYDSKAKEYLGVLDVRDFVAYAISLIEQKLQKSESNTGALVNFRCRDPFVPLPGEASLAEVISLFVTANLHRTPLVGHGETDFSRMVSQSTIVAFLHTHREELDTLGGLSASIRALGAISPDVVKIDESSSMLDIFKEMAHGHLNGCAIVDQDRGCYLRANVSTRDFEYCLDDPKVLHESFAKFSERYPKVGRPVATCCENDSFLDVLSKFAETKLHRLYVVPADQPEDKLIPLGVVTLSDMLRVIVKQSGLLQPKGKVLGVMLDQSTEANKAFQCAVSSKKPEDKLVLIHAVHIIKPVYSSGAVVTFKEQNEELEHGGKQLLLGYAAQAKALGVEVESALIVTRGNIRDRVIEFLVEKDVSLIFVGTRGLSTIKRVLLGSFSQFLVNTAPCNVMIVRQ